MKKNIAGLILWLLLAFLLCGCRSAMEGNGEIGTPELQMEQPAVKLTMRDMEGTYRLRFDEMSGMDIVLHSQPLKTGVVLLGYRYQEKTDSSVIVRSEYRTENNTSKDVISLSPNQWISAFCMTDNDCFFALTQTEEDEIQQTIKSDSGIAIDDIHELQESETIQWMFEAEDFLLCLTPEGSLLAFYLDGSLAWRKPLNCVVVDAFQTESKRIVLHTKEETDSPRSMLQEYRAAEQTLQPVCEVPEELKGAHFLSGEKWNYDVMAYDSTYLYGWEFDSASLSRILKFEELGMASEYVFALECLDEQCLLGIYSPTGSDRDQLFTIEKTDQTEEKTEIVIGGYPCTMSVKSAMTQFNQMYPEYLIKYVDYVEQYGAEAEKQLNMDLLTGNAPDLILANGMDYEAYAERGLLEDLYPWIEQDQDLSREDFLPNLLQSMELDGKLYDLPQSFGVAGVVGLDEIFGRTRTCTVSDLIAAKQQLIDGGTFFFGQSKEGLAADLLMHGYKSFIDPSAYTANFDCEEFREILELLYEADEKAADAYVYENELSAQMKREILLRRVVIRNADQFDRMLAESHDEIVCMGYPGTSGPVFYLNNPFAITSNSPNQEAAWTFLKFVITSDAWIQGQGWSPLAEKIEQTLEEDRKMGVREESIAYLREIIGEMDQTAYFNQTITDVILDELQPYFHDLQTKEETIERINNRIQLYLDETKKQSSSGVVAARLCSF